VAALSVLAALAPGAGAATLSTTFTPAADAYVSSAQWKVNFGLATQLSVASGSDTRSAYVRFGVTGLTAPVTKATLRVWSQGASTDGVSALAVKDTTWGETTITSQNGPPITKKAIASSGGYGAGQYVSIVITSAVSGNGALSLALGKAGSTNGPVAFDSREGAHPPQLVVETTDNVAPVVTVTSPAGGATLSTATPSLAGATGTAAGDLPAVTVRVYAGATATGSPVQTIPSVGTGGLWSATPSALADGTYTVQAQQSDTYGNTGTSAPRTFSIDSTAPVVSLTVPAAGARLQTATPALSGVAGNSSGDGSQVTVRIYAGSQATGTPVQTRTVSRSGSTWAATATALVDGTFTARAEQADAVGNVGRSAAVTFVVDTAAPVPGVDVPAAGATLGDADPLISGHAGTDPFDVPSVTVELYSGPQVVGLPAQVLSASVSAIGEWSLHPGALADGTWTVRVLQSDAAGNQGAGSPVTFAIDTQASTVTIDTPASGAVLASSTPQVTGTAGTRSGDDAQVTVKIYAGADTDGSVVQTLTTSRSGANWSVAADTLTDGTYTLQAEQTGITGVGTSAPRTFSIDTTGPAVDIDTPAAQSVTHDMTPDLGGPAGTSAGDDGTVSVALFAGTDTTGTALLTFSSTVAGGRWSATASRLDDGDYTVRARQGDAAGNTTTATATFTVVSSYRDHVLADGPSAYWRLGELSGTSAASETSADTGTYLKGAVLGAAGAVVADSDTAVDFDGINDTVSVPSSTTLNPTGRLSLELWARPNGLPAGTSTLMRKDGQYLVRLTSTGAVLLRLWNGASQKDLQTPAGLVTSGAWNQVVATWDGTTMAVYVNGAVRATTPYVGPVSTTSNPLTLASSVTTNDFFKGRLDEAAVYPSALSAARVRDHWNHSGVPDITAPTVTITSPTQGSASANPVPTFMGAPGTEPGDATDITVSLYAGAGATGTPVQTLHATSTGATWTVDSSSPLAAGTYTARAEQSDAAGNVGRSAAVSFQITSSDYWSAVEADTPSAYWRLGETTGTLASSETHSNHGTYLKGVVLGQTGAVAGDPNSAARLDGVNDTISVASAASLSPSPQMTLETWIKPDALPAGTSTLMRKDGEYLLRLTRNGGILLRTWVPSAPGGVWQLGTAGFVRAGYWNHIVATRDGTATAIYVNGVLRATGTLFGPAGDATGNPLFVGSSSGTNDYFAGLVDETAIYGSALSASRVRAHFDAAAATAAPPVVTLDSPAAGSTMDAAPTFGGHAEPGRSSTVDVKLYDGTAASGTPVQTLTTALQPAGTFSVAASASLPSGTYSAKVEQTIDGVVFASAAKTFGVDASAAPALLVAGDISGCDTFGDEATAALLDRLPGTVVAAGDLAYEDGSASDFANCYDPSWGRQRSRTRPSLGDHDYRTPGAAAYFDYFGAAAGEPGKGYYSYDVGSWHVVTLNADCDEIGGCDAGSPQEHWLRADLADNAKPCTIAVLHTPLFSSGTEHGDNNAYKPFWQVMQSYGVEAVVGGADHLYERFAPQTPDGVADPNGIREFTVGSGGRSHYPFGAIEANSLARNNDTFGVLKLTLREGAYDWEFVPEDGMTFTDTGSDACH
jgi:hypothetical protein